jgi:hypothetical protein
MLDHTLLSTMLPPLVPPGELLLLLKAPKLSWLLQPSSQLPFLQPDVDISTQQTISVKRQLPKLVTFSEDSVKEI